MRLFLSCRPWRHVFIFSCSADYRFTSACGCQQQPAVARYAGARVAGDRHFQQTVAAVVIMTVGQPVSTAEYLVCLHGLVCCRKWPSSQVASVKLCQQQPCPMILYVLFAGALPECWGNWTGLHSVNVSHTNLTGLGQFSSARLRIGLLL